MPSPIKIPICGCSARTFGDSGLASEAKPDEDQPQVVIMAFSA